SLAGGEGDPRSARPVMDASRGCINVAATFLSSRCENDVPLNAASANTAALSLPQARALQLHAQGLLKAPRRRSRRIDVVAAIERMRLLRIDSIHVVARSPYLVLHARLGDYPMAWLDEALADGRIAECWAHEACFVGARDLAAHRASAAATGRSATPSACIASTVPRWTRCSHAFAKVARCWRRISRARIAASPAGGSGSRRSAGWKPGSRWAI